MLSEKSGANVLLVTPSVDAQQRAKELVARKGYIPHTASNAFEALFQLGAFPINAIVCEANLPGRDSQWLLERVNQLYPGMPFIVSENGNGMKWEQALEQLQPIETAIAEAVIVPEPIVLEASSPDVELLTPDEPSAAGSGRERRSTPRYRPKSNPPAVHLRGGREGRLRDLSVGGALIETDAHVGPGRHFELRFGTAPAVQRVMAKVVRCDVIAVRLNGVTYRAGVAFKSPLEESDVLKLVDGEPA